MWKKCQDKVRASVSSFYFYFHFPHRLFETTFTTSKSQTLSVSPKTKKQKSNMPNPHSDFHASKINTFKYSKTGKNLSPPGNLRITKLLTLFGGPSMKKGQNGCKLLLIK